MIPACPSLFDRLMAPFQIGSAEQQNTRLAEALHQARPALWHLDLAFPCLPDLHPVQRRLAECDGDVHVIGGQRGLEALRLGPCDDLCSVQNVAANIERARRGVGQALRHHRHNRHRLAVVVGIHRELLRRGLKAGECPRFGERVDHRLRQRLWRHGVHVAQLLPSRCQLVGVLGPLPCGWLPQRAPVEMHLRRARSQRRPDQAIIHHGHFRLHLERLFDLDRIVIPADVALAGCVQPPRRHLEKPGHGVSVRGGAQLHVAVHKLVKPAEAGVLLLVFLFLVHQKCAVDAFGCGSKSDAADDFGRVFRPAPCEVRHEVWDLEHIDFGFVNQRQDVGRDGIDVLHLLEAAGQDAITEAVVGIHPELIHRLLAVQPNEARWVAPHAAAQLPVFRLAEAVLGRVILAAGAGHVEDRQNGEIPQPALADAVGVDRLGQVVVARADQERCAAKQPRQLARPQHLDLQPEALFLGLDGGDLRRAALPLAPLPAAVLGL